MPPSADRPNDLSRRRVLAAGAAGVSGALLGSAAPVAAQGSADFGGWFDGVANYDGVVDRTGKSEVTITVGVQNGQGPYGFGPAAVRVDPGTTVVWKWTGKGGSHNVVAQDGSFKSELVAEAGHTFTHTFESDGVFRYFCVPHKALGMKGAVVVGDVSLSTGGSGGGTGGGDGAASASGGGLSRLIPEGFVGWFALICGTVVGLPIAALLSVEAYLEYRDHKAVERAHVGETATEAPDEEAAVEIDDDYDPVGTAVLVAGYFVLIALLWLFMYFVEYIGGPSITG